jgi:hypothetical protein
MSAVNSCNDLTYLSSIENTLVFCQNCWWSWNSLITAPFVRMLAKSTEYQTTYAARESHMYLCIELPRLPHHDLRSTIFPSGHYILAWIKFANKFDRVNHLQTTVSKWTIYHPNGHEYWAQWLPENCSIDKNLCCDCPRYCYNIVLLDRIML